MSRETQPPKWMASCGCPECVTRREQQSEDYIDGAIRRATSALTGLPEDCPELLIESEKAVG